MGLPWKSYGVSQMAPSILSTTVTKNRQNGFNRRPLHHSQPKSEPAKSQHLPQNNFLTNLRRKQTQNKKEQEKSKNHLAGC